MTKKFRSKPPIKKKALLFEEIVNVLAKQPNKTFNYKQIAAELNIKDTSQRLLINAILTELKANGSVLETERGKFKIKSLQQFITGKVDMISSGSAYIISDESENDVYVSQKNLMNALHGDKVKIKVFTRSSGKKEGEVVDIIQRAKSEFVGTIQLSSKFAFLVPGSNKMNIDIYIPLDKLNGAKDGQKAIAKIIEWPKNSVSPIGEITEVLGNVGENDTEMHAILAEFGLPYQFPKDVERAGELIPTHITEEEIRKRRDYRDIFTITIDPVDAKDFDDAISLRKLDNGNWEVGVHIADVSYYVKSNSIIDKEAVSRATSIYLVDRVVPMLPEILSNNVCSLRPNEDKLCFAAVFELNDEAQIMSEWFGRTIINSNKRFTYEEAQEIIETKTGTFSDEVLVLDGLAKKLREERFKKGSIAFEKMEVKFHLDENGNPTGVFFKQSKDANKLIEDFMLLANRRVAEFVGKKKQVKGKEATLESRRPFVYRVHDKPDPDKLNTFAEFVGKFGYTLNVKNERTTTQSLNKLLTEVNQKKEAGMIELLAIRTMAKAIYTTKNIGHYGLGFDYYTHFTSPIRRYPDVMVHRLLQHYLDGGKNENEEALEEKCKHSSDMEKLAAEAERSSIKYKQVQFLQDKIGEEYDGVVSGVTEWGIFVEIIENHCEGMVRIREIKDDNYYFDEENYCLRGSKYNKVISLGDKVRIEVKSANLAKKQLDFALIETKVQDSKHEADYINYKKKQRNNTSGEQGSRFKQQETGTKKLHEKTKNNQRSKSSKNKGTDSNKIFNEEWGFEV